MSASGRTSLSDPYNGAMPAEPPYSGLTPDTELAGLGGREVLSPGALDRRADPRGARVHARARRARDPGRRAARARERQDPARIRWLSLRGVSAPRRAHAGARRPQDARMDRSLYRAHSRGGRGAAVRRSARARHREPGPRAARLAARPRFHSGGPARRVEERSRPGARARRPLPRARGRGAHAAPARGLPRRKHAVDRRGAALRRLRRLPLGPGDPGPVDAALGRPRVDDAAARRRAGGLRGFPRLRSARAPPARSPANAAPYPLLGLDRAALGRSRFPRRVSLVQHPALLAGPRPRAEGADRSDGRSSARGDLSVRIRSVTPRRVRAPPVHR